jgi:hypothetical protein
MDIVECFIKEQYRDLPELSDDVLMSQYCSTQSVRKRLSQIKNVLLEFGLTHLDASLAAKKLLNIPPGTKAKVRGDQFNRIVANEVRAQMKKLKIDGQIDMQVEKRHDMFHEIPDWILTRDKKVLVGYNQISLFGGGHQLNRASKYVLDDSLHAKLSKRRVKMVCVVKDIPKGMRGKSHDILIKGIARKRIYCVGGIKKLLREFFVDTK